MKMLTVLTIFVFVAQITTQITTRAMAAATQESSDICRDAVTQQEQAHGVPDQLLSAISMVESGRWDENKRAGIAWPWTVTSGGSGNFFPSKASAIAEVRRLQKKGIRNIDVGCMQINLMYHSDAFDSLEEAFDPDINTAYAADFLVRLYDNAGSWLQAAASYHSMEPERASYYRKKVVKAWNEGLAQAKNSAVAAIPIALTPPLSKQVKTRQVASLPPVPTVTNEQLMEKTIASRAEQAARVQSERDVAKAFAINWRAEHLKAYVARKAMRVARVQLSSN